MALGHGVGEPVGEEEEKVAPRRPRHGGLGVGRAVDSHGRVGGEETPRRAAGLDDEGVGVTGVRVPDLAVVGREHAIAERDVHLRRFQLGADRLVHRFEDGGGRRLSLGGDGGRAHHQRHDQGRRVAVTRHVADHDAQPSARQLKDLVEVASHRDRRLHASRRVHSRHRPHRGQQLHLQVVGQLHFAGDPIASHALPDEPVVLERGADLVGDRGEQPLVRRREAAPAASADQVDHAHRAGLPGLGRVAYRHGEPSVFLARRASVPVGARHVGTRCQDGAALAVRPDGHRGQVIQRNRLPELPAPRLGGQSEALLVGSVHPQRAPLGAQHSRDLFQDQAGGLFQVEDRAQGLADPVEQVDLGVALRQGRVARRDPSRHVEGASDHCGRQLRDRTVGLVSLDLHLQRRSVGGVHGEPRPPGRRRLRVVRGERGNPFAGDHVPSPHLRPQAVAKVLQDRRHRLRKRGEGARVAVLGHGRGGSPSARPLRPAAGGV